MDCGVARRQLEQFLAGSLDGPDMALVGEHVLTCEQCAQALRSLPPPDSPFVPRRPSDATPFPDPEGRPFFERLKSLPPPESVPIFEGPYTEQAPLGCRKKYRVVEEIGRGQGSYGCVFKVHDPDLNQYRALKVLKPAVVACPGAAERFVKEAEAAARVEHRHVVVVHEVLRPDADFPWPAFVMQYVPGGSLADLLRECGGKLDPRRAARYAQQTAAGLAEAHAHGLVHRDVKPRNLLLNRTIDEVKITDFGVVRVLEELPRPQGGSIQGSPAYWSPEQLGDPDKVGPASDVYNLGATLYELVVGRPPFDGPRREGEVIVPPRRLNPDVPRDLEAVILRCLDPDPRKRFLAAGLYEELGRFLAHELVKSRQDYSTRERAALWRRRSPLAATLALVLAVTLLAGTLVSAVLGWRAHRSAEEARQHAARSQEIAGLLQEDSHALSRAGVFAVMAGRRDEAKQFFETAISVRRRLVELSPDVPEYRHDLALARMHMGNWHLTAGRYQEAIDAYEQCRPELRDLVEQHPTEPRYRFQFANTLDNHGMALLALERPGEAEAVHRLALTERRRSLEDFGADDPTRRAWLASTLNHLGNALKKGGNAAEAEGAYAESLQVLERLAEQFPDVPSHRQELAYACTNLGSLYLDEGKVGEAEPLLVKAVEHQQRLYRANKRVPDYGGELAAGLVSLGDLQRRRGATAKALASYEQALGPANSALGVVPESPVAQQFVAEAHAGRAACLLELGRGEEGVKAAEEAGEAARGSSVPAEALVKVARALAAASASSAVGAQRRERLAARAVELLREARGKGYFQLAAQAAELNGADFAPLREQPEFRALRAVVTAPK
ncbi:MAG TPA: serine/threonine-protein kinase [Gemmataceae bacterium]|nr:serine/threonine-protein kinase [Gemmataceae bacterium]